MCEDMMGIGFLPKNASIQQSLNFGVEDDIEISLIEEIVISVKNDRKMNSMSDIM